MVGSPLDLAWSHILDDIYLKALANWGKDEDLKRLHMLLAVAHPDKSIDEAMDEVDTYLKDSYSNKLPDLNSLRQALQTHHLDENGELQTIDPEDPEDPEAEEPPKSLWDTQHLVAQAVNEALSREDENLRQSIEVMNEINSMLAARFILSIPDKKIRKHTANKMMRTGLEGDIWHRPPSEAAILSKIAEIQTRIDHGYESDKIRQYGPAHLRKEAERRLSWEYLKRNKQSRSVLGDPNEILVKDGVSGLQRQLRYFLTILAHAYAYEMADGFSNRKGGFNNPEIEREMLNYEERVKGTPKWRSQVQRELKRLRTVNRRHQQGKTDDEITKLAERSTTRVMVQDALFRRFWNEGVSKAQQSPLFHEARSHLESFSPVFSEGEGERFDERENESAFGALTTIAHIITERVNHQQYAYGTVSDAATEQQQGRMDRIKYTWEQLNSEEKKILLGLNVVNGPLLGILIKKGMRRESRASGGAGPSKLPGDAMSQFAKHVHKESASNRRNDEMYALDPKDSVEDVEEYLSQEPASTFEHPDTGEMLVRTPKGNVALDEWEKSLKGIIPVDMNWSVGEYRDNDVGDLMTRAVKEGGHEQEGLPTTKKHLINWMHNIMNGMSGNNRAKRLDLDYSTEDWLTRNIGGGRMSPRQALNAVTRYSSLSEGTRRERSNFRRMRRLSELLLTINGRVKDYSEIIASDDFARLHGDTHWDEIEAEKRKGGGQRATHIKRKTAAEKRQFIEQYKGMSGAKKCEYCDEEGNDREHPWMNCRDAPHACHGWDDEAGRAGMRKPQHIAQKDTDANRKFVESLVGELVGWVTDENGERHPAMQQYNDPKLNKDPNYSGGLLHKADIADKKNAIEMGLLQICPTCKGHGETETDFGNLRQCSTCAPFTELRSKENLRMVPDMGSFYSHRGWGFPREATFDKEDVEALHASNLRVRDRLLSTHVSEEQGAADESLRKGFIPPDKMTTPYEIHPITSWPALHTEKGPLSAKGISKARALAVRALNESPQDSKERRVEFVKDFLREYYRDIFSRISDGVEGVSKRIIDGLSPENAVDAGFMDTLFGLMAANLPFNDNNAETLPDKEFNRVMSHLTHAHNPDFDGRNMLVDDGTMQKYDPEDNSTHCTRCGGSGHELDVGGMPTKSMRCWDPLTNTGCAGTGSEGVKKMLKRQPWITRTWSLDEIGDMFRKGLLEKELGRAAPHSQNRWLNPQGVSCETCGGGRAHLYHTTTFRGGNYNQSGKLVTAAPVAGGSSSRFMSDWSQFPSRVPLPIRPGVNEIGANEEKYRHILLLMKQMDALGPSERYGNLGEIPPTRSYGRDESGDWREGGGLQVKLSPEAIKEKIRELERELTGEGVREALMQYHQDESIIPKFKEGWEEGPYLIPTGVKIDDDMPCPYCNKLKVLGLLHGDVHTIAEHKEGSPFPEFAACPEAEKRGDSADLSEMVFDIKQSIGKSPEHLLWERVRDIYEPILSRMQENYQGRGEYKTPLKMHTMTGSTLGVGAVIPRGALTIANARMVSPTGHNPADGPGYRGRRRYGDTLWAHNSPITQSNEIAILQNAIENLPVDEHGEHALANLLAMHILEPNYMLHKHGNPLGLPLPELIERKREEGLTDEDFRRWYFKKEDDLWGWARKILGKSKNEYGLADDERVALDMGYGKLQPLLNLAKRWGDLNFSEDRKQLLDASGIDEDILPRSIFSFDSKKGTFLHKEDVLDNILMMLKHHAFSKLERQHDSAYDADDVGYTQPHENNPSMDFFIQGARHHQLLNGALAEAWRQHDDETLGKFNDGWVVTGKSMPDIDSNRFYEITSGVNEGEKLSLTDLLWRAITNGRPIQTKNGDWLEGHRFPSMEDIHEVTDRYRDMVSNWLLLRNEIFLRSENKELSRQRMKEGNIKRAQVGTNTMGTSTRCLACKGRGAHWPGMNDAAYWWSTLNPYQENDDAMKEYTPHIGGRKLSSLGEGGHQSHEIKWGHPDAIDWVHEHMKTSHGHEGKDGWHEFFERMKSHGFVPSDWEIFNEDGNYSSKYINWLGSQQGGTGPQCVICEGSGHCHGCDGEGRGRQQLSKTARDTIHNIRLLNAIMHAKGMGDEIGDDGVWHSGSGTPVWTQLFEHQAGRRAGFDLERFIEHKPDGYTRLDDEGNPTFESAYLPIPWETDDGQKGVFGTTEQYEKDMDAYVRRFIIQKMMESENHYLRSLTAKAKSLYEGKMPGISEWPTLSPSSYTGTDEGFKKWLSEATKREVTTLHRIVRGYGKTAEEYRDKGDMGMGHYPDRFKVGIEELRSRARKLLAGKTFQSPDGEEDIEGNANLEAILDPFKYGDFENEEDWRLSEWVHHDPLNISQWGESALIDEYQKRTGHTLTSGHTVDDIRRLIYADEDRRNHFSDIWPSWFTEEHKDALHRTGVVHNRDEFKVGKKGRCEHPFCGAGLDNDDECRSCKGTGKQKVPNTSFDEERGEWLPIDGDRDVECANCNGEGVHPHKEPLMATHSKFGEGEYRNPYGRFCENHHHEMIHKLHMGDNPILGKARVFGGHDLLRQIIGHTNLEQGDLEEALQGKVFDEEDGAFFSNSGVCRLGLSFIGMHLIKGNHGNEDYYMPYFEDSRGRRGTAADFGLGHESSRVGDNAARIHPSILASEVFWQPQEKNADAYNRGIHFFDRAKWDYGRVANRMPMIKLTGIDEMRDASQHPKHGGQWKLPTGNSLCPECFSPTPSRQDDKSEEGEKYHAQNDKYKQTVPNCECGHSYGEWTTNIETGKLRYVSDMPPKDHVILKSLLFAGGSPPHDIYGDPTHVIEGKHRERLRERMENYRDWGRDHALIRCDQCYDSKTEQNTGKNKLTGEPCGCHAGLSLKPMPIRGDDGESIGIKDEPINHVLKFGGKLVRLDPYDKTKKTEIDSKAFLQTLKGVLVARGPGGEIERTKKGEVKYVKNGKRLYAKAERMFDPNFRIHVLHPGFGSRLSGLGFQPMKGASLTTASQVAYVIRDINKALKEKSEVTHQWERFQNSMLRLDPSLDDAGELGGLRLVDGESKWTLSTKGRRVAHLARKINANPEQHSEEMRKSAKYIVELTTHWEDPEKVTNMHIRSLHDYVRRLSAARNHEIETPGGDNYGKQGLLTDRDLTVNGIPPQTANHPDKNTTIGEQFAQDMLSGLQSGHLHVRIPLLPRFTEGDDSNDITHWPHPDNPNAQVRQTCGIRPDLYHTLRDQHAEDARSKLSSWQRDHHYHGAAQEASIDEDSLSAFMSAPKPSPIPEGGNLLANVLGEDPTADDS